MKDKEIKYQAREFTKGLLGRKFGSAGNCAQVSMWLQGYLGSICQLETELMNAQVIQNGEEVNHYFLQMSDGRIIDATASQFNFPDGKQMPKLYFGSVPDFYIKLKQE